MQHTSTARFLSAFLSSKASAAACQVSKGKRQPNHKKIQHRQKAMLPTKKGLFDDEQSFLYAVILRRQNGGCLHQGFGIFRLSLHSRGRDGRGH